MKSNRLTDFAQSRTGRLCLLEALSPSLTILIKLGLPLLEPRLGETRVSQRPLLGIGHRRKPRSSRPLLAAETSQPTPMAAAASLSYTPSAWRLIGCVSRKAVDKRIAAAYASMGLKLSPN